MKEELIFHQALELAVDRRAAYLDEACGQDVAMRQRVDVLLRAHSNPGSFLASPAPAIGIGATLDRTIPERAGQQIGPYKLLQQIGEGGMGVVYMAEQLEPVQRRVALKIIKPGMDTRQVIARFEAERQALALMDHPNIAKVLDAGTTGNSPKSAARSALHGAGTNHQAPNEQAAMPGPASDPGTFDMGFESELEFRAANLPAGRPYFVMELVRGVPITHYCDEHHLSLRQRLELFVTVCQAIQHAHQKGIIHRDIKPTNVLVAEYDEQVVAKIIDFGVAKAVGSRLTERTLFTEFGQLVGTLEYMSPEQAKLNQLDIDTRSDIYSLGVLLYELLAGTTPLDRKQMRETSLLELLRIVREEDAPTLSNRLSTTKELPAIAASRGLEPAKLRNLVRGELDWIVAKALEKDRNRRYETASALAADVQRYLKDEPVEACPPSAWYRFHKFARRHQRALVTAAVVALTLLLTAAGSGGLIWRANSNLQQALESERRGAYFERIALAEREWATNNLGRMEQLLDDCPEDLRGWEWRYLKRLRFGVLAPLRHESPVYCVAFSHDGQYLATATQGGFVRIWRAKTGQELQKWHAHEDNAASSVAFSPDGQYLATGGWDAKVNVWDVQTVLQGEVQAPLIQFEHTSRVRVWSVAFSPDGKRLASAGGRSADELGEVKVWDMKTRQTLLTLSGFSDRPGCVRFSPDGRRLAVASPERVQLWDSQTGREELSWRDPYEDFTGVAFSPDGRRLAAVAGNLHVHSDREVKVWEAHTGKEVLSLRGHVGGLRAVDYHFEGRRLASTGLDQTVKLWDAETGEGAITLRGHLDNVFCLAFSPDGHRIASGSLDKTVRIWDATPVEGEPGPEYRTLPGHHGAVTDVAFHPTDGRSLVSAGTDGTVRLWDFRSGNELATLPGTPSPIRLKVAFSPDGRRLAVCSRHDRVIKVLDAATAKEVVSFEQAEAPLCVAISSDGRHAASAGYDFTVRVWDATTGKVVRSLESPSWVIWGVAFSPDGRHLAACDAAGTVRVWDWTTGEALPVLEPHHAARVAEVAFSRDGKVLASASWDRTIKLWDTTTWKLLHELPDPSGAVLCVAFGRDRRLAWGSTDGTVKVWDGPGTETHVLRGHTSWVQAVAFSAGDKGDDKWIASSSLDGTVKVWKAPPESKELPPTVEDEETELAARPEED